MKMILLLLFLSISLVAVAQFKKENEGLNTAVLTQKYFSFNPFGLLEPQAAIGLGFGNRFSERSEYFTELSYIGTSPIYKKPENIVHGFRFLAQYRYHFLQRWRPIFNWGEGYRRSKSSMQPFIAAEFRIKPFNFSGKQEFINSSTADTLNNFSYQATGVSLGGAILFGSTLNISGDGKWKFEFTFGLGVKQKLVTFKNAPPGYSVFTYTGVGGWHVVPAFYETIASVYFPSTIRLRYIIK